MKKMQFGKSKGTKILNGKGFYIALAFSLLAIGIATYFAINQTIADFSDQSLKANSGEAVSEWGIASSDTTEQVGQTQSDVAVNEPVSSEVTSEAESSDAVETPKELVFAMPLSGEVAVEFSNGELVKSKTLGDWRTHDGIDIKVNMDTPVKSAADGTVTEVREDTMWGNCVTVEHADGYTSHYYGLTGNIEVKEGQEVIIGDVLGYVGDSAIAEVKEEVHLHFALKKDGAWIDPLSVINAN